MTPLALIGIIMAATLLGAFGLLSRNPEQREKAKALRLAKYKKQIRKLDNMIFGLPPNYLPKTLKVLIYGSIIDSLKHLGELTGNKSMDEQIARVKQTPDNLIKLEKPAEPGAIEIGYSEFKECKYLLKDLYTLILDFHNEKNLDKKSAASHLGIVRKLMLEVTLDTYNEAALQALNGNNKDLALHYFPRR